MDRATSVYIAMLLAFGTGLWAILSIGSIFLHAPADLAGMWELRAPLAGDDLPPVHLMSIEQSGRFVRIRIGDRSFSLKMQKTASPGICHLQGTAITMVFEGNPIGDEFLLAIKGEPTPGAWRAVRTARTYAVTKPHQTETQSTPTTAHAKL